MGTDLSDETDVETKVISGGAWKLYISRALTAWGDRLWTFGMALFLLKLYPKDLVMQAGYGLANTVIIIIFGAWIGSWIDSTKRLKAAKSFLIVQNTSVSINCVILALYFQYKEEAVDYFGTWSTSVVAVLSIVITLVSTLASAGSKIVVEKDWIVVIAGDDDNRLAYLNSIFRTIDLVCLTATPALAGFFFEYTSYTVAAIFIGSWNLLSVVFEYLLLISIYKQFPRLAHKQLNPNDCESSEGDTGLIGKLSGSYRGWVQYFTHKVRNAGLGLAFLYMTVLGFDNITWSYAVMECVTESVLGVLVAVSALVGIAGSLAFPPLRKTFGEIKTGLFGMSSLVACLSLCVISVWLPGSPFDPHHVFNISQNELEEGSGAFKTPEIELDGEIGFIEDLNKGGEHETCRDEANDSTSISVLLIGIILARFGLWMADLSITQILQENVEEHNRGIIGGVQNALNSSMNLFKFCLVLIMPGSNMFGILIILSFVFVSIGAVNYTSYAFTHGKLSCCGQARIDYSPAKTADDVESKL